jgi:hypothetical protein
MAAYEPYQRSEADAPDEDHPRAGWYVTIIEDGLERVFGPFVSEPHAEEFAEHCQEAYAHAR